MNKLVKLHRNVDNNNMVPLLTLEEYTFDKAKSPADKA